MTGSKDLIRIRTKRAQLQRAKEILRKAGAGNPPMEGDELPPSRKPRRKNGRKVA